MKYTKTITINGDEYVADDHNFATHKVVTYYGNSGRPKPTYEDGARDADRLMETDTGKVYVFDEDTKSWTEV